MFAHGRIDSCADVSSAYKLFATMPESTQTTTMITAGKRTCQCTGAGACLTLLLYLMMTGGNCPADNYTFYVIAGKPDPVYTVTNSLDGIGTNATFLNPRECVVDANYNVYVADCYNNTIRKISPLGTNYSVSSNWNVTTIAGTGSATPGIAGPNGHVDGTNASIRLSGPFRICLDCDGNLLIAEWNINVSAWSNSSSSFYCTGGNSIRKLARSGTNWVASTVSRYGPGNAVAGDSNGNVFGADVYGTWKYTNAGGNWVASPVIPDRNLPTFSGGTSTNGTLCLAAAGGGCLYAIDRDGDVISLKSTPTNWHVTTVWGTNANPLGCSAVKVDDRGSLWCRGNADPNAWWLPGTIYRLVPNGTNWAVKAVAQLDGEIAPGPNGTVFVVDTWKCQVKIGVPPVSLIPFNKPLTARLTKGAWQIEVGNSKTNWDYGLERSRDLVQWTVISNAPGTGTNLVFLDAATTGANFYRATAHERP